MEKESGKKGEPETRLCQLIKLSEKLGQQADNIALDLRLKIITSLEAYLRRLFS